MLTPHGSDTLESLSAVHRSELRRFYAELAPILSELRADPKFKQLVYLVIDFDTQKDLLKRFGVGMQSTLIVFKGATEEGRSVGDTNRDSIFALAAKAL